MIAFTFLSAKTEAEAIEEHATVRGAAYLGGGTNLIDDWKLGVEQPMHLIDVRHIGTS